MAPLRYTLQDTPPRMEKPLLYPVAWGWHYVTICQEMPLVKEKLLICI
jgi:hypothetical protein